MTEQATVEQTDIASLIYSHTGLNAQQSPQEYGEVLALCKDVLAISPASKTDTIDGWSVAIEINGKSMLTISDQHLSSDPDIGKYADIVRSCAVHLLVFIGNTQVDDRQGGIVIKDSEAIRNAALEEAATICMDIANDCAAKCKSGPLGIDARLCEMCIRALKSAAPSTIKAEPTGEKL